MNDTLINSILEHMLYVFPVFHKKLHRMDLSGVAGNLTHLHFAVIGILSEGDRSASELSRLLMVTKPQMTHVIDQLVKQGIVERQTAQKDRRVIVLSLTKQGYSFRDELKEKMRENIKNKLSSLNQAELKEMAQALESLRKIGEKL